MNSFLSGADWDAPNVSWGLCNVTSRLMRRKSTGCIDSPGFGSGLTWNPCSEKVLHPDHHALHSGTAIFSFDFPQASVICMPAFDAVEK